MTPGTTLARPVPASRCLLGQLCGMCSARRREVTEALRADHAAWQREQRRLAAIRP